MKKEQWRCDRCKKWVPLDGELLVLPDECAPYNDGRLCICRTCSNKYTAKSLLTWAKKELGETQPIAKSTTKPKTLSWLKNYPIELGVLFENAVADGLFESIGTITKEFALKEAEYLWKCFHEHGHALNEGLRVDDADARKYYWSEKQKLKRYIERVKKSA